METGLQWTNLRQEVNPLVVKEIEKTLSVTFPNEYSSLVTKYHGATPKPNTIAFGVNKEETIQSLLSLNPNDNDFILKVYGENRHLLEDNIIPFAKTQCLDLIGFDYRDGGSIEPFIVYWNYDLSLENIREGIYPICNTFIDFLYKLANQ